VVHPAGMHHPIVEAVLAGDEDAAYAAMRKHTIEFGYNFIKMDKDFREKNSLPYLQSPNSTPMSLLGS